MQLKHLDFHYLVIHVANLAAMFSIGVAVMAVIVAWGIKFDEKAQASTPPTMFIDQAGGNYGYQPATTVDVQGTDSLSRRNIEQSQSIDRFDIISSASLNRIVGSTSIQVVNPNHEIIQVRYSLDSQPLGVTTTAPFELNWNSNLVPNGYHWIKAQAVHRYGLVTERALLVQVGN